MIARRPSRARRGQTAVSLAIDLVMVTAGVLIALQLGLLVQARADQQALRQVLERLDEETATNLEILDNYLARYARVSEVSDPARAAIQACQSSPEIVDQVVQAMSFMAADLDPSFVSRTADEISRQDRYLDRLSPEFRASFNRFQAQLIEDDEQSTLNFALLWDNHVLNHRAVSADLSLELLDTALVLTEPIEVLCRDNEFKRRYFITAALIAGLDARMTGLRAQAIEFREVLALERERQG